LKILKRPLVPRTAIATSLTELSPGYGTRREKLLIVCGADCVVGVVFFLSPDILFE